MRCKNCKTKINKSQKFCPECGAEVSPKKILNKKAQAFIACACCLVLIISGTIGGLYFYRSNNDIENADSNYIALEAGFTDIKVTDEKSALEAISTVADIIGIENVDDELKISSTNTIDNDTYYRFQQYYNDIPVYGKSINLPVNVDGKAVALTSNYYLLNNDLPSEATVSQAYIEKSLNKYFDNRDITLESIDDSKLVYYIIEDNKAVLAYELPNTVAGYIVFVDANNGKILYCKRVLSDVTAEVSDKKREVIADGWKNDDGSYHLYNNDYKVSVFDLNGIDTVIDSEGRVHTNFKDYNIDTMYSKNSIFKKEGVLALKKTCEVSQFYKNLGNKGFERIHVAINDNYDNGNSARGGGGNFDDTLGAVMLFGKNFIYDENDVIGHEYTHAITHSIVNWDGGNIQTSALDEGYSDIMGVLFENTNNPDWTLVHLPSTERDMTNPRKNGHYKNIEDIEPNDENFYHYSTIISHTAYLMWNGIDGTEKNKITPDKLTKLWYQSLYLLQSDATFSQCRNAVELSARIMLKNGELTPEQYQCVRESFEEVGIENAPYTYYYLVKNDFYLRVLNSKETDDVNFNLKVSKPSETELMGAPELVLEENSLYGNKEIHLEDGVYYLEITDLDENAQNSVPIKTKILVDGEDENAADEVVIHTDFSDITTVEISNSTENYEDIYYQYINENIVTSQGYCREYEESFSNIPESDIYFKMKDIKGISSAFIKDLNNDSIPEMITVSMLGKGSAKDTGYYDDSIMVDIHCYSLDKSNNVVDCGSACSINTFKNADEQVYVYFSTGSEPRICISRNYWSGNSSAASIFGQAFTAYTFSNELIEKESVLYHFSHGNETYTINGSESSIDVAIDKADNVFKSLGLEELSINNGWNKFPKNSEKICTFGTNYSKDDSYKVYIVDYTNLQQHMNDKYSNNDDLSNNTQEQTTTKPTTERLNTGSFAGNKTAEQLRKSIIGSWGALGSIVPEYSFIDNKNCSGESPWQSSGNYSISDDKALTIKWSGKSEKEEYVWSEESWDDFYSHHEYGTYFWCITDDGILKINGKEKYRDGVDNFTYNSAGDLMAIITGAWISDKGYKEYQINSDGTWVESTVVVSGGILINRTKLDNGKVEIIDDTTAKLWQEVDSLSQIPGASELIYDSKNDKISVGGKNNTYTRAKYK